MPKISYLDFFLLQMLRSLIKYSSQAFPKETETSEPTSNRCCLRHLPLIWWNLGYPTSSPSVVRGRNNNNTIFSWPGKLGPGASPSKNGITKNGGQGARFVGEFFFWRDFASWSPLVVAKVISTSIDAIIVWSSLVCHSSER